MLISLFNDEKNQEEKCNELELALFKFPEFSKI
jgi:hypothetical protein